MGALRVLCGRFVDAFQVLCESFMATLSEFQTD